MKNKLGRDIHKITDFIIITISLIAFAALLYEVKYYNDKTRIEQEQLIETGNYYQETKSYESIDELIESLVINEVNQTGWLELYNKEKNIGIEISNCYVTVNGIKKYTFPKTGLIKAGEFLCIEELGRLGAAEHDIIGLFDENGNNLKNIMLPSLNNKESYGCRTDGDISYCYLTASKGKSNSGSNIIKKDKLVFSVPGGFYDDNFRLEITAAEGMTIYYTLDGTKPTNKSEVYKDPILIENKSGSDIKYATAEGIDYYNSYEPNSISMGMVVSAIAVDSNGVSSEVKTQSYFIGLKNASDIVNLPVISITGSPDDFFDYFDGIYVTGRSHEDALAKGEDGGSSANYLNDWVKEVNVEYFEPQKDKTYEGKMSISIIKDASVTAPQKSLLLTAEGGAFSGSGLVKYYNDISNMIVLQTNRNDNYYKIREYLAGRLLEDTMVGTPDIIPCIVFIDGEYWGGYMLKAMYDEKYIAEHYDVEEGDVLIAQNGNITNKPDFQQELDDLYYFITNNDLKEEDNYAWVKAHLDVQNYLEYICANVYLANAEFDPDELLMWRTIKEQGAGFQDGKWRFLMSRLDNTMKNAWEDKTATSSINTYLQSGIYENAFFKSLLRNDEFKNQLTAVMRELADNNFSSEQVESAISEVSGKMKKMVEVSYRRFYGYLWASFYTDEIDDIESFFQQRKKYILRYTDEIKNGEGISDVGEDEISE